MGYINENYDGVIIKLPSFFIKINNLESVLDNFKKELEEKAKLSLMLPDYTNSLFELENYKEKQEFIKEKKRDMKRVKKDNMNYYKNI